MLRKIRCSDARIGMYVDRVEGSWLDHALWKTRFAIRSADELRKLRDAGVEHVWIDTDKGDDLPAAAPQAVDGGAPSATATPQASATGAGPGGGPPRTGPRVQSATAQEEMGRAAKLVKRGREAVRQLFAEARMGQVVECEQSLELVDEVWKSIDRNESALVGLARLKTADEDYTYLHSFSVCAMMIVLARHLGRDDAFCREAGLAGLFHDLGKVVIPFEILHKPGRLTDEEFAIVRTHPVRGHELLRKGADTPEAVLEVCLRHHERPDGRGYPDRLSGDDVTQLARMGAICDVYDAITSNRPYKAGWDPAHSLAQMASWKGQFDEPMLHVFVRALGIYPIGSLVKLRSGKLAVVVEQTPGKPLAPVVKVFFSTKANAPIEPQLLDLNRSADGIASREDPARWGFKRLEELWAGPDALRASK